MKSIKACGALFVRTRKAATYIKDSLAAAREGLAQAFVSNTSRMTDEVNSSAQAQTSSEPTDQVHLVIAVVLLQTIGLFHQNPDERATSNLYHGMLVMMIRRAGLISKNSSWTPTNASAETMWHDWAFHEMTKRKVI